MVIPMTSHPQHQQNVSQNYQQGGMPNWSVNQSPSPSTQSPSQEGRSMFHTQQQSSPAPPVRDYPSPISMNLGMSQQTPTTTGPPRGNQRYSPPTPVTTLPSSVGISGQSQRFGSGRSVDWRSQNQSQQRMSMSSRYIPSPTPAVESTTDVIDTACRTAEALLNRDLQFPTLFTSLIGRDNTGLRPVSGLVDHDYPELIERGLMPQKLYTLEHQAPIPPELREMVTLAEVGSCHLGLFPEIGRAWMTIDSDLYLWDYRDGSDLSFYDGLKESILGMALVPVKPNVFKSSIRHLLCVTTPSEIFLLGFILVDPGASNLSNSSSRPTMEIVSHPIFTLSSEDTLFPVIVAAKNGRIFLGAVDGSVHEVGYQAGRGWLRNRCWKTNVTRNILSALWPKFLTPAKTDPILDVVVDNARKIVFTLNLSGAINAYDLGSDGSYFSRVGTMSMETIVNSVLSISKKTLESTFVRVILSIAPLEFGELNLVAVTDSGTRLYFTCYERPQLGVRQNTRPNTLQLAHIRLPPGYCPMSQMKKPSSIHKAFFTNGMFALACSATQETDVMWFINPFMYASPIFAEISNIHMLPGVTLDIKEIKCSDLRPELAELPDVMTQHLPWQRQIVVLTGNGTLVFRVAKPYELLRDLLVEKQGPDNIKAHFELVAQKEQALANVVVVAIHPFLFSDNNLHDWATKALFTYGSETLDSSQRQPTRANQPGVTFNIPRSQGQYDSTVDFNPNIVSTPNRELTQQQQELMHQQRLAQVGASPLSPGNPVMSSTFRDPNSGYESPVQSILTPPYSSHPQFQQVVQDQFQYLPQQQYPTYPTPQDWPYSPRHDALYLVVVRILLPFWNMKLVRTGLLEGSKATNIIVPNISGDEVSYAITFLHSMFTYITSNPTLYLTNNRGNMNPAFANTLEGRRIMNSEVEKNSISNLRNFLGLTLEVLGMWKILCDHQFHIVLHDIDDRLHNSTMRDLVVGGHTTVSVIINALINKYLGDNAAVDAISLKLREVCPSLFKNEDAIGSKVAEILSKAKNMTDPLEKNAMLKESLSLCEQICGHGRVNVKTFCRQFADLGFPLGSVRLCVSAAKAADPNELALSAVKSSVACSDPVGIHAYQNRADVYKIVFEILDTFVTRSTTRQSPLTARKDDERLAPETAKIYAEQTVKAILASDDETFHITLYNWLLERKLFDQLLEIKHPFLDAFLQRAAESVVSGKWPSDGSSGSDTRVLDLLWRHHEMNQNHHAAATILSKLADSTTTGLNLQQRLEYLSRAVICAKSGGRKSDMLETLEDKLEVAQIQKLILDTITIRLGAFTLTPSAEDTSLAQVKALQDVASTLNGQLFNISVLYTDFAVPYKLHEAKLEIFHAAGHTDRSLIESLWADIVEEELTSTSRQSMESQLEVIRRKLVMLGRKYINTPTYFPLEYLVEHLESMKPTENVDPGWVFATMSEIGVSFPELLLVYEKLWKRVTRKSSVGGVDAQIARVVMIMIDSFARGDLDVRSRYVQRSELVEKCKDVIAAMIVEFSSRFDQGANDITNALNNVKERLEHQI